MWDIKGIQNLGSLVVFILGHVNIDWTKWGNLAIVIMTGLTSLLLYLMGITTQIWVAYAGKFNGFSFTF